MTDEELRNKLAAEYCEIEGWNKRVPYVDGWDAARANADEVRIKAMIRKLLAKEVLKHEKTKKELSKLKSQIKKLKANKVKS